MRLRTSACALALLCAAGCSAHYQEYALTSFPELEQGTLVPVGESAEGFVETLVAAGATNITVAHGIGPGGCVLDAVAADYLYHVYVFKDGEYLGRAKIPCDPGRAAVHPTIKIVQNGPRAALVLFADVMTVKGRRAGLLVHIEDDGLGKVTTLPLDGLIDLHGGMRDPYVGGTDLAQGILVTARDDGGLPWPKLYVVRIEGSKLTIESVPYGKGFSCSCFADWVEGKDGRKLFGEVVE